MISTEELALLRALEKAGGETSFRLLKRMVAPYPPSLVEEICWALNQAGYLKLTPYTGSVKLTQKGEEYLAIGYYWRKARKAKRDARKSRKGARVRKDLLGEWRGEAD